MAFFTIRSAPDLGWDGMQKAIDYLDLEEVGKRIYSVKNGKRLEAHKDQNGWALEPSDK